MTSSLCGFDYAVIGLTLFIGLKGLFNGTMREFFGLAGLAAGLWAASRYGEKAGEWIGNRLFPIDSPSAGTLIGFSTILLICWIAGVLTGLFAAKKSGDSHPRWLDRIGGMALASVKSFLILSVIVYALFSIDVIRQAATEKVSRSRIFPWMERAGQYLLPVQPVIEAAEPDDKEKAAS
ncbi:MAG: CvpA family protein [Epsilonproteobacteria bacterium]|nr:CvpA family protein [Campylobacterota bacterium]